MTAEKPDPKLIATRDWARSRIAWKPGRPAIRCRQLGGWISTPLPPQHDLCDNPQCGCDCHQVSEKDRQIWRQIADEIDAYLEHSAAMSEPEGLF